METRPAAGNLGQAMTWFLQGHQAALAVTGAHSAEGPGRIGWLRRGPYTNSVGKTSEVGSALANYIPVDDLAWLVVETVLEALARGYVDFSGNPHAMRRLSHGVVTVQQAAFWAGAEETCHAVWFKRLYSPGEIATLDGSPELIEVAERGIDAWMIAIAHRLTSG